MKPLIKIHYRTAAGGYASLIRELPVGEMGRLAHFVAHILLSELPAGITYTGTEAGWDLHDSFDTRTLS
ncbi:MAG TPA: hypothetical protein VLJ37_10030 [bacterium]|nr:hypothetical protein [bacterium]